MVGQRPQQCFMTPLLVGTDGAHKMSKSLGNYIGVAEPPDQIYGKTMSIPRDDMILQYFELLTDVPDSELAEFKQGLKDESVNPMILKKRLARELVAHLYDQKAAIEAEENFEKVFQKKETPKDIREHITEKGVSFRRFLVETNLAGSLGDADRLIAQGAVSFDGKKIYDRNAIIEHTGIVKVGKIRFVKPVIPGT